MNTAQSRSRLLLWFERHAGEHSSNKVWRAIGRDELGLSFKQTNSDIQRLVKDNDLLARKQYADETPAPSSHHARRGWRFVYRHPETP